jgi:AcrR family transcriptional regulator
MDQALISLLQEKDIEYISVKELCGRAGVNRSTFYLHYETIGDLIDETVEYITGSFYEAFGKTPEDFLSRISVAPLSELVLVCEDYLRPYLKFIYDNRGIFKAAVKNPASFNTFGRYSRLQQYIFDPIMERFQVPKEMRSYWAAYYVNGTWAIIEQWLNRDCAEGIEQIENIIISCVRPEAGLQSKRFGE